MARLAGLEDPAVEGSGGRPPCMGGMVTGGMLGGLGTGGCLKANEGLFATDEFNAAMERPPSLFAGTLRFVVGPWTGGGLLEVPTV